MPGQPQDDCLSEPLSAGETALCPTAWGHLPTRLHSHSPQTHPGQAAAASTTLLTFCSTKTPRFCRANRPGSSLAEAAGMCPRNTSRCGRMAGWEPRRTSRKQGLLRMYRGPCTEGVSGGRASPSPTPRCSVYGVQPFPGDGGSPASLKTPGPPNSVTGMDVNRGGLGPPSHPARLGRVKVCMELPAACISIRLCSSRAPRKALDNASVHLHFLRLSAEPALGYRGRDPAADQWELTEGTAAQPRTSWI